ncbi:hypothetical protein BCL76_12332 [Streptomyces sp. CG 926]|uniref:hypothetical protein n=1 Tax=Streptomyces sp. CG 926 TaxID=1882405 RepID=UPI000D6D8200|nr:hypothetical protein [Streptomyces sp. CG 926]PWK63088.1 hypothetical protein BCL76_12332 [Streptomyces sp. CG 926]
MTATSLDPRAERFKEQLEAAFAGEASGKDFETSNAYGDVATITWSLLENYIAAAEANPKGYKVATKDFVDTKVDNVPDEKIWPLVWAAVETLGPLIIDIATKEFKPQKKDLISAIDSVPAHRRKDKGWVDYATTLALILAQGTVQVLSDKKDFGASGQYPTMPKPPKDADPAYFRDALTFATASTKFLDFSFHF